ncbi:S-methyl-5-thioribose-1-phosphate isomerase [Ignicoccus hospitalis]|uniref:Putative methylthioribose-1-phosphate isomerase n=1 Tax=Ignicoccus hospitalis (strain KIN4/I / DSM 18386 / JCM 14125) TaxID=453591 RepID=A8A9U9_IGNH4|nr:S-methyl-5-thioribose-1-phosphate isomerase [Ignicoccus hospitalis]ABU81701.1 translation initiation factor 2B subunit I family (IF-2BI) [Ignicoccus hospitalis KIN4/I]HIH90420.1 S-methyl-5-thioribose-1-phosphate isomerase [Desulfurococcaceae archaeon]
MEVLKPVDLVGDKVVWLDTRYIPWKEVWKETTDYKEVARAIKDMEVRGAPAIGVAAAFGMALAALHYEGEDVEGLLRRLREAKEVLANTRPTAVNLFWALERVMKRAEEATRSGSAEAVREAVVEEARKIQQEDIESNVKMGKIGAKLIEDGDVVLTHCNTGSLATAGYGTALGVIRAAWEEGKRIEVIATETRPLDQGARLTVWELKRDGIPVKLIADTMVGYLMSKGKVDKVFLGADRILLSGHFANKIGTYQIAVLAKHHGVPFYVVAPTSTVDPKITLDELVIEERDPDEVRRCPYPFEKVYVTVRDVEVYNPAFDVTPPELVTAIITERGIAYPPFYVSLKKLLEG